MIDPQTVSFPFIKLEPFTGSDTGMRYRLEAIGKLDKETKEDTRQILANIWPEPFNYTTTDSSMKTSKTFAFSIEGKDEAVKWLNEQRELQTDIFDAVSGKSLLDFIKPTE